MCDLIIKTTLEQMVGKPNLFPNTLDDYDTICFQDFQRPLSPVTILKTGPVKWGSTMDGNMYHQPQHSQGTPIRPCIFFCLKGECKNGHRCHYSHDPVLCQNFDSIWRTHISFLKQKGLYRMRPCQQFQDSGYCHKGDYCTFNHE